VYFDELQLGHREPYDLDCSYLDICYQRMVTEMQEVAKKITKASLHIHVTFSDEIDTWKPFFSKLAILQCLTIGVSSPVPRSDRHRAIESAFRHGHAPLLQSLKIVGPQDVPDFPSQSRGLVASRLLLDFLAAHVTNLRTLRLKNALLFDSTGIESIALTTKTSMDWVRQNMKLEQFEMLLEPLHEIDGIGAGDGSASDDPLSISVEAAITELKLLAEDLGVGLKNGC